MYAAWEFGFDVLDYDFAVLRAFYQGAHVPRMR
jgi:hypothetical protein